MPATATAAAAAVLLGAAPRAARGGTGATEAELKSELSRMFDAVGVAPGVALQLGWKSATMEFSVAAGSYNLSGAGGAGRRPATTADTFLFGSGSKAFTAAAIMRLADAGALSLDDPVSAHADRVIPLLRPTSACPACAATWDGIFPGNGSKVTVGMLLTMRSGVKDYETGDGAGGDGAGSFDEQILRAPGVVNPLDFIDHIAALPEPFYSEPGTAGFYSSTGYVAAGLVLTAHSGAGGGVGDWTQMRTSSFYPAGVARDDLAHTHFVSDGPLDRWLTGPGSYMGWSEVCACPADPPKTCAGPPDVEYAQPTGACEPTPAGNPFGSIAVRCDGAYRMDLYHTPDCSGDVGYSLSYPTDECIADPQMTPGSVRPAPVAGADAFLYQCPNSSVAVMRRWAGGCPCGPTAPTATPVYRQNASVLGWTCSNAVGTTLDVAKWFWDLLGPEPRVVSAAARKAMMEFRDLSFGTWGAGVLQYGVGLMNQSWGTLGGMIGHGGDVYGFNSVQGLFWGINASISIASNIGDMRGVATQQQCPVVATAAGVLGLIPTGCAGRASAEVTLPPGACAAATLRGRAVWAAAACGGGRYAVRVFADAGCSRALSANVSGPTDTCLLAAQGAWGPSAPGAVPPLAGLASSRVTCAGGAAVVRTYPPPCGASPWGAPSASAARRARPPLPR